MIPTNYITVSSIQQQKRILQINYKLWELNARANVD